MAFQPSNLTSKEVALRIDNISEMQPILHALSTELRLGIIRCIAVGKMSINELAHELDVPVSTIALNVQVLEKAGLISCDTRPGQRGVLKLCNRRVDKLTVELVPANVQSSAQLTQEYSMPVGGFIRAEGIQPTCGLAAKEGPFEMDDSPDAFYHPQRFRASLLWMREGFVEYAFPKIDTKQLEALEFSFEACSEAPYFNMDWPSDIYICVNGVEIGVWHCPSDFGGRRGRLNPNWWGDANTQYGHLKTWRIDRRGTMLDSVPISNANLNALNLNANSFISLIVGTKKIDGYSGGLNLFGRHFGDFPQDILMRAIYS